MALLNPAHPETGCTPWDYADAILQELRRLNEETGEDADPPVARIRRTFVIPTDGSGNGSVEVGLPPGIAWNLLAYAYQIPFGAATPTGYIAFYRDVEEGTGLVKVTDASSVEDDSFNPEGHWIPEQSRLLVVARGVLANSQVSGNVSMKGIQNAVPRFTSHGGM